MHDKWMAGHTALITGAAGGIGRATVEDFASLGARLMLVDRDEERLAELGAELTERGIENLTRVTDVRSLTEVTEAVDAAVTAWGRLDYAISVAGGGTPRSFRTMTSEDWDAVIALNLTAPMNVIHAAAPVIARSGGGAVVTVGSLAAVRMSANNGPSYTAAKAGVLGLTRHAAFEFARDGVAINTVLPGPVLTPQLVAKMPPEVIERMSDELPLGRFVDPSEISHAIVHFCHPRSRAAVGTSLIVDAGYHIGATSSRDEYFSRRDA